MKEISTNNILRLFVCFNIVQIALAVPGKKADTNDDRETGDKVGALIIVTLFGALGGFIVAAIQGLDLGFYNIKPLCTCITCPALVGMIIFGCIARNFFGDFTKTNYPDYWADWIRQVCLSIILMRGGLQLNFSGIGKTVALLTLCPQVFEATTVAFLSYYFFDMPWVVGFANGFCIGAVSPAVLLQSVMRLIQLQRGTKKGIPSIMLIASSFDDIVAITVFSVFISISFDQIRNSDEGGTDIKVMIGMNVFYFVIGILFGAAMGWVMGVFNKCTCDMPKLKNYGKFVIMLTLAITLPFICHYTRFDESKYIGIIFFGYFSYRVWGEDKPDKELANFWLLCQPFLFSSVGASIIIDSIDTDVLGKAIVILLGGVFMRWLGTFLVTGGDQGFTVKERAFFAFSWIPKATVQAAIGGIVLDLARNMDGLKDDVREQYIKYGNIVLTMAVISILLTAPTGAILINTLGLKWLSDDSAEGGDSNDPEAVKDADAKDIDEEEKAKTAQPESDGHQPGPMTPANLNGNGHIQMAEIQSPSRQSFPDDSHDDMQGKLSKVKNISESNNLNGQSIEHKMGQHDSIQMFIANKKQDETNDANGKGSHRME